MTPAQIAEAQKLTREWTPIYRIQNTVTPKDAVAMVTLTPTERLEWLKKHPTFAGARNNIDKLLEHYEHFLETTNFSEDELVRWLLDKDISRDFMKAAYTFGDLIFETLNSVGEGSRFHRLLVV